jgi:hypothetical protein
MELRRDRSRRKKNPSSTRSFIFPKLYLCCVVAASGGPRVLARGIDDSSSSSFGSRSGSPSHSHGDGDDSTTSQRRHTQPNHRRILPSRPHGNENYGYDSLVIDPINMFGSPRGGFGRDVPDRLSSLPLYVPSLSQELPPDNPTYLQVRDGRGRLYACRVYHQDELDAASWDGGLFDLPRLVAATKPSSPGGGGGGSREDEDARGEMAPAAAAAAAATSSVDPPKDSSAAKTAAGITLRDRPDDHDDDEEEDDDEVITDNDERDGNQQPQDPARTWEVEVEMDGKVTTARTGGEASQHKVKSAAAAAAAAAAGSAQATSEEDDTDDTDDVGGDAAEEEEDDGEALEEEEESGAATIPSSYYTEEDVEERLAALEGTCAHIHLGWWSTEWSVVVSFEAQSYPSTLSKGGALVLHMLVLHVLTIFFCCCGCLPQVLQDAGPAVPRARGAEGRLQNPAPGPDRRLYQPWHVR